ncbi:MAG TPA: PIG-L family deacetylase [Thermomicrobiales bacterium]|nr:PIG-L family deacetylase [Thermomicrobiales bacterium]
MPIPDERLGNPPVDLLWILAHPDDESFGSAGTMAWANGAGLRTAYVCATRGDVGEIRDSHLATRDTLAAVREQELREAMSHLGLGELRILGFRDSGMENTSENEHPLALINQPIEALLTHLVGHIRDLRPDTIITFGPEGIYGHPDHVLMGKLTTRAVELAADPSWLPALHEPWCANALYFASVPRELILAIACDPAQPLGEISEKASNNLGSPASTITHWLDVSRWLGAKRQAIIAHRTQIDPDEIMNPESQLAQWLHREQYTRRPLPWDPGMANEDPLTRARDEFGSISPPAGAIP